MNTICLDIKIKNYILVRVIFQNKNRCSQKIGATVFHTPIFHLGTLKVGSRITGTHFHSIEKLNSVPG